ncbi:MAG TPA: hypothetical protein VLH15_08010 [Dehalococcoidales bacterium]|nr:hypothetical protein [Dehalococcoidales bacterium]
MIEITDGAREKLQNILEKNPGKMLRISVDGDGCAGPYFKLSLDEPGENEIITSVNGAGILVSDHVIKVAEFTTLKIFENQIDRDWL